jgi:uncharacterized membrane protein YphA (DoxX/SURF4 family)
MPRGSLLSATLGEIMRRFISVLASLAAFLPFAAHAHEVYVLSPDVVQNAIATPSFSEWQTILTNIDQFTLWAFIVALVIFVVFFVSISRVLEKALDPIFAKLPAYAPAISRVTISLSFLAGAYYNALCGPELPLTPTFGAADGLVRLILVTIALMLLFGWYTRIAALVALVLFSVSVAAHGWYMLTYTNYLGEILILIILGSHALGFHGKDTDLRHLPPWLLRAKRALAPYSFLILRIAFGTSLLYASLYAKVIHNNLALQVAYHYPSLVHFFGFEPHFLVLGAGIIEIIVGVFFILGIEIRFTSLFVLFWLSLSLWYFGEAVWPHIILIGIPIAYIFYGYDQYSLEGRFFKRGRRQPVL